MKKGIHPKVYKDTKVTCACGNTFYTQSTLKEIHVEVCSQCHPFYTGVQKFVDTEGRVDSFKRKQELAKKLQLKRAKKLKKKAKRNQNSSLTLKDLLKQTK